MNEEDMVAYLLERGYKIQRPPKVIKDEYTFEHVWDLYQKKVGPKDALKRKWNSMSFKDRKAATEYVPAYVLSQPDKQFRKNFQTFLNQRAWEDELIGVKPTQATAQQSDISHLIDKTEQEKLTQTKAAKDHALRQRIYGMIETLRNNPDSFCREPLRIYYNNGTMQRLGIQWKP